MGNTDDERLLELHQKHRGLYERVAKALGISPGYVSLIASGKRQNEKVRAELIKELRKLK
jgi:transcriptional regulator with XRE-family HTH domain